MENHTDEQYLARKNLRELPQATELLEKRIVALTEDRATIRGTDTVTVGGKPPSEPVLALASSTIPVRVDRPRRFLLGVFHSIAFGVERVLDGQADVYPSMSETTSITCVHSTLWQHNLRVYYIPR